MKNILPLLSVVLLVSCSQNDYDSYLKGRYKKQQISLSSKYPGKVSHLFISEGDKVKQGDTLAELEFPEVEAKLQQAAGAVQAAKAQYQMALNGATDQQMTQIMAKLEAMQQQYDFAEKSFDRVNAMHEDGFVSDQKFDEVQMKLSGAKAQLTATQAQYESAKNGIRNEKIRMALGTYDRARGAQQEALVAYNERFIIAPKDINIETITLEEGELALPGYTLFNGYQNHGDYFRFTVAESEIHKFKKGMNLVISNPYTESTYQGQIIKIKQLNHYADITTAFPEYKLGESVYELIISPKKNTNKEDLYVNMTVLMPKR
ncbi:MAG: HlyD family secretion protein [Flavobacteriaceae bacterium]